MDESKVDMQLKQQIGCDLAEVALTRSIENKNYFDHTKYLVIIAR